MKLDQVIILWKTKQTSEYCHNKLSQSEADATAAAVEIVEVVKESNFVSSCSMAKWMYGCERLKQKPKQIGKNTHNKFKKEKIKGLVE